MYNQVAKLVDKGVKAVCISGEISLMETAVSQEEAPFFAASSIDFWRVVGSNSFRLLASYYWFVL